MKCLRLLAVALVITAIVSLFAPALAEEESLTLNINATLTLDGGNPGGRKFAFKLWNLTFEQRAVFFPRHFLTEEEWAASGEKYTNANIKLAHARMLTYLEEIPYTIVHSNGTQIPIFNETIHADDLEPETSYPLNFVIAAVDDPDDNICVDDMIYSLKAALFSYHLDTLKGVDWSANSIQCISAVNGYMECGGDELDESDVPGFLTFNHKTVNETPVPSVPGTGDETPVILLAALALCALAAVIVIRRRK